jgi:hypothetical protein
MITLLNRFQRVFCGRILLTTILLGAFCASRDVKAANQPAIASENWEAVFARMPLIRQVTDLNQTNCIPLMLQSFESNQIVKALIFLPGATDEFHFFQRARASLTNRPATLLDAVRALTNQTLIRATFRSPFLLLHTDEDPIEPLFHIEHRETADKVRQRAFLPYAYFKDRDWDFVLPLLEKRFKTKFVPIRNSSGSWHFYRHSLAAWNLTGWEALEAISLAGKTTVTVQKRRIVFQGDTRTRSRPKL